MPPVVSAQSRQARTCSLPGRVWQRRRTLLMALTALFASGCAGKPKPARIEGDIVAALDLNPSVSRRPSPLVLRIYELRAATAFDRAGFMALYEGDQAALASDLVSREELVLQPGEKRPWKRTLNADTRFIGLVGLFRDLEHARWRALASVSPGQTHALQLRADALAVSLAGRP